MNININIDNLPPMPFAADWEYHYGPVNEKWQESLASGVVYHFHEEWHRSGCGLGWVVYARPKPAPEPEPEPENITLPVFWDATCPRVATVDEKGYAPVLRDAFVGLLHIAHGREYRLSRFLFPDGASLGFSVDENFGGATKATHARFYLVAE